MKHIRFYLKINLKVLFGSRFLKNVIPVFIFGFLENVRILRHKIRATSHTSGEGCAALHCCRCYQIDAQDCAMTISIVDSM
jgi:hypothetical protein